MPHTTSLSTHKVTVQGLGCFIPLGSIFTSSQLAPKLVCPKDYQSYIPGQIQWTSTTPLLGMAHTNLHMDLHVEHCNACLKEGLRHCGGELVQSNLGILIVTGPNLLCNIRKLQRSNTETAGKDYQHAEGPLPQATAILHGDVSGLL